MRSAIWARSAASVPISLPSLMLVIGMSPLMPTVSLPGSMVFGGSACAPLKVMVLAIARAAVSFSRSCRQFLNSVIVLSLSFAWFMQRRSGYFRPVPSFLRLSGGGAPISAPSVRQ